VLYKAEDNINLYQLPFGDHIKMRSELNMWIEFSWIRIGVRRKLSFYSGI